MVELSAEECEALMGPCFCDPAGSGEEYCHETCIVVEALRHLVDDNTRRNLTSASLSYARLTLRRMEQLAKEAADA